MLHLWHAPIYTDGIAPEARFPRERYARVRRGIEELGPSERVWFHEPEKLPCLDDLHLAHCPDYTSRFLTGSLGDKECKRIGLQPWTDAIVERTLILTNGTISATRKIAESGGVAGNLGGGTHHAYFDFGSGYCIFNDLAISARIAQRDHGMKRVLILDLDVHQGDGTAAIFENDPTVRTVSFHCGDNFPFRKMRSDHDQVFAKNTGDDEYLETLHEFLESEFERFEPDILFYQAGVDGLITDRLGQLSLTRGGLQTRNQLVFQFAKDHHLPLLITMGGGYGEPLETSIAAHVDVFLQAADLG
tara:strand:+ start:2645 stop:3553 length:909 start_codon:yes stop_codon:yes gene_type:complete